MPTTVTDTGFTRPTLTECVERVQADMQTRLPGITARIPGTLAYVLAVVVGAVSYGLNIWLGWIARQVIPDLAEGRSLERHAGVYGLRRRAAVAAVIPVEFTTAAGTTIPDGTLAVREDGVQYELVADVVAASAGTHAGSMRAVEPGEDGNPGDVTELSLVSPLANVSSVVDITGDPTTDGVDRESDEDLRERLLQRIATVPHSGAEADYETWALEVAGVDRVWVVPLGQGAGTVGLRFTVTGANPIPDQDKVDEVVEYVQAQAPVTATVYGVIPELQEIAFAFSSITPDTAATRAAAEAALSALIEDEGGPGLTIPLSRMWLAVSAAAGVESHDMTTPSASVTSSANQIPKLGTITWPS